ncbi:MAG: hypothetical protein KDB05_27800 [Planctomycetales bacterium]|nr:hypothetical protein [Planctomycetales bacterium]
MIAQAVVAKGLQRKRLNRIAHASGLSIIAPDNWEQIDDNRPDIPFLWVAARVQGARRLTSYITIEKHEQLPAAVG